MDAQPLQERFPANFPHRIPRRTGPATSDGCSRGGLDLRPAPPGSPPVTVLMPRRLSVRERVGATALLRQPRALVARELHVTRSTIVLVLAGRKSATTDAASAVALPGDVMLLPAGAVVDLLNEPGPLGAYEAISVTLDPSLTTLVPPEATLVTAAEVLPASEGFQAAVRRAREVVLDEAVPLAVARHAAGEVTAWLAAHGRRFEGERASTFAGRLRGHIADSPDARWDTARAADLMAVGEATLRRRLARSGLTLTDLVQDVRMSHALTLLQAGDDPVVQVALACGYGDQASFARRFKTRFGLTPTEFRSPGAAG